MKCQDSSRLTEVPLGHCQLCWGHQQEIMLITFRNAEELSSNLYVSSRWWPLSHSGSWQLGLCCCFPLGEGEKGMGGCFFIFSWLSHLQDYSPHLSKDVHCEFIIPSIFNRNGSYANTFQVLSYSYQAGGISLRLSWSPEKELCWPWSPLWFCPTVCHLLSAVNMKSIKRC